MGSHIYGHLRLVMGRPIFTTFEGMNMDEHPWLPTILGFKKGYWGFDLEPGQVHRIERTEENHR